MEYIHFSMEMCNVSVSVCALHTAQENVNEEK